MSGFDFQSILNQAVSRLDEREQEILAGAAQRIAEGLAEQERRLHQSLTHATEISVAELCSLADQAGARFDLVAKQKTGNLAADISVLRTRVDRAAQAVDALEQGLNPIWSRLRRNLYLGAAGLTGIIVGAALTVLLAATEHADLQNGIARLAAEKADLAANIAALDDQTGFRLVQDGDRVLIALDDDFRIERHVSVRGPLASGLSNAWRVVPD